jgi:polysaccharide biosynthesis/export protein
VLGTLLNEPIDGYYQVDREGIVNLGPAYGMVRVAGMTVQEAIAAVTQHLQRLLRQPAISIRLAQSAATQEITGIYKVQPDGMVNLRRYGVVPVAGKTVVEAKLSLEEHLAQFFDSPQLSVEVLGYNSKSYYVILPDGGGGTNLWGPRSPTGYQEFVTARCLNCSQEIPAASAVVGGSCPYCKATFGSIDQIRASMMASNARKPFMISGNETVLDAISEVSQFQVLPPMSHMTIWVARPAPGGAGSEQILPVDWDAITRGGITDTNYQLLPGDRIYIKDDNLVSLGTYVAKVTAPIERLLGISTLGASTVRNVQTLGRAYNQSRSGF